MAQIYGPHIATDGLVLSLDASDVNSYPAPIIVSVQAYSVYGGGLRSANYTVQFSDDNSTWTTAFTGVMSNNSSCGIITGTGVGSGAYGRHRYWRYVEGSAVVSHHPRVSRIDLIDINGTVRNLVTYTSDNCSDSGTYIVGTVSADLGGTTWYDMSGTGGNATLQNGIIFTNTGVQSMYFDGTNDFISITSNTGTRLANTQQTISFWVFVRSVGPNGYAELYAVTSANRTGLKWQDNGIGMDANADFYNVFVNVSNAYNTWMNITCMIDRGAAIFYVYKNGVYIGQDTFTAYSANSSTVTIGANNLTGNGGDYMKGSMASVMIYSRILSAQEVLQNYNALKSRFGL